MIGVHGARKVLDGTYRGVPPECRPFPISEVAGQGWRPDDGSMAMPVLTLDEAAYLGNRDLMLAYVRAHGAAIAPHAKTPMCPQLAADLVDAGAWGATVASLQQAAVLLRTGIRRLIIGNEIGGQASGRRLGTLLAVYPEAEVLAFADSPAAVESLAAAAENAGRDGFPVLAEVGAGRAGARCGDSLESVLAAVAASGGRLALGGVATYEGAAPDDTARADLLRFAAAAFRRVRALEPRRPLVLTAGGSAFFDRVVETLAPVVAADRNATLILRSGAVFFADHGVYARAFAAMDARGGFAIDGVARSAAASFVPAIHLWAEVLSRPEPELAICGFGMRDASFDQDLPLPLAAYRDGRPLDAVGEARVTRLNDQHAFLAVPAASPLAVGDIVKFGISHPCTCLDRWRVVFGVDAGGRVTAAYPTLFG